MYFNNNNKGHMRTHLCKVCLCITCSDLFQMNGTLSIKSDTDSGEELVVDDLPERLTVPPAVSAATVNSDSVSAPSCVMCNVLVLGMSAATIMFLVAVVAAYSQHRSG